MAPYYEEVCTELNWPINQALVDKMKAENEKKLKEFDEKVEDAETNLGETEIRDFMLNKAEYLCRIGAKVRLRHIVL